MAWLKQNSSFYKYTSLPDLGLFRENSRIVLSGPYGEIEFVAKTVNSELTWVADRALTNLEFYFSENSGTDTLQSGSEASPFATAEYVTSNLLPKKVLMVNFNFLGPDDSFFFEIDGLENVDPIKEYAIPNRVYFNGVDRPQYFRTGVDPLDVTVTAIENVFDHGACTILTVRDVVAENDYPIPTTPVLTIPSGCNSISVDTTQDAYGTGTGWQRINVEIPDVYVKPGDGIINTSTNTHSIITKVDATETLVHNIYIKDSIFSNTTQGIQIVRVDAEMIRFITATNGSALFGCYPVVGGNAQSVLIINNIEDTPAPDFGNEQYDTHMYVTVGDTLRFVKFTAIEVDIIKSKVDLSFIKSTLSGSIVKSGDVDVFSSKLSAMYLIEVENAAIVQSMCLNNLAIRNSFSSGMPYGYMSYMPVSGITFHNTHLYINNNFTFSDSKVTFVNTFNTLVPNAISNQWGGINLYSSVLSGYLRNFFTSFPGTSENPVILIQGNSKLNINKLDGNDRPTKHTWVFNSTQRRIKYATVALNDENTTVAYETREDLMNDFLGPNGVIATVIDEPGNSYQRISNKWVIMTGNKYESGNVPTDDTVFTFVPGLEIFNITTGLENTWYPDPI